MAKKGQTDFPAQWFKQTLDHFNGEDTRLSFYIIFVFILINNND